MTNLSKKLGEMNFDGLFTDVVPAVQVRGPLLRSRSSAARSLPNPMAQPVMASW